MNSSSNVKVIKASTYTIQTKVEDGLGEVSATNGVYSLVSGKTYKVTITSSGNSKTGYVNVQLNDYVFKTEKTVNLQDKVLTFTVLVDEDVNLSFVPIWGYDNSSNVNIINGKDYKYTNGSLIITEPKIIVEQEPIVESEPVVENEKEDEIQEPEPSEEINENIEEES